MKDNILALSRAVCPKGLSITSEQLAYAVGWACDLLYTSNSCGSTLWWGSGGRMACQSVAGWNDSGTAGLQ